MSYTINACMASYPPRAHVLEQAVASIAPQVDRLYVYLNGYEDVPECLRRGNITAVLEPDGDLGDAGKFWWSGKIGGYIFTVDDDLLYPDDYVDYYLKHFVKYGNGVVLTCHGKVFPQDGRFSFHKEWAYSMHCLDRAEENRLLHIGGTGVMAFHSSLGVHARHFHRPNMADVWMARYCQQNDILVIGLAHDEEWIGYDYEAMESLEKIWDSSKEHAKELDNLVNSIQWTLPEFTL